MPELDADKLLQKQDEAFRKAACLAAMLVPNVAARHPI
jgi:hypothetical protein